MDSLLKGKKYYQDAYLTECRSQIKDLKKEGEHHWYLLDETIFYPEGGGQNPDRGTINGISVEDVQEKDGGVWHLLNSKIDSPANLLLDWPYRYGNMQQHTGQHILSALLHSTLDIGTVSVHLGERDTLIELDCADISAEQLKIVENEANRIVRAALPVEAKWEDAGDVEEMNLRRAVKNESHILRLIGIENCDLIGCGGTHVKNTAEVGCVKILGFEKIRNHVRIKAVIGEAALDYFSKLHENSEKIKPLLSSSLEDTPEKIVALLEESRELGKKARSTSKKWLDLLAREAIVADDGAVYFSVEFDNEELLHFARTWCEYHEKPIIVIAEINQKLRFAITLPAGYNKNANDFVKDHGKAFAMRGGGNPLMVQGQMSIDSLSEEIKQKIKQEFLNFVH